MLIALAAMLQLATLPPCGAVPCTSGDGADARRLREAWISVDTTDEQRQKMQTIISGRTTSSGTDREHAAEEYFQWRQTVTGYGGTIATAPPPPNWRVMREVAEANIRSTLIDPSSSQFDWPRGFAWSYWKPFLQKRISGWVTCGLVNARNRMGGYVGRTAFVVVMDANPPVVTFRQVATTNAFDAVAIACGQASSSLPPPPPEMLDVANPSSASMSIADELAKLGRLRDQGLLTPQEFNAQKAKLLAR